MSTSIYIGADCKGTSLFSEFLFVQYKTHHSYKEVNDL